MKVNAKCSALMAAFFLLHCAVIGYVTYYLKTLGLSELFISIVVATSCAIGGVMQIVAGRIADRSRIWNWRNLLLLAGGVELVISILRLFIPAVSWQWFAYGLMIVLQMLMMPLVNVSSFDYTSKGMSVNFSIVRGFGSIAYAAASYIIGMFTDAFAGGCIPVILTVLTGVFLVVVFFMPDPALFDMKEKKEDQEPDLWDKERYSGFRKKYPVFCIVVFGQMLILVFHNMVSTFLISVVESIGGNSGDMGIALAVAAIAELPILFLYSRIDSVVKSSKNLLVISNIFFVVRAVMFMFAANMAMIYIIQLLQSVSFGLMVAAKASYAEESMGPDDRSTGQALMSFTDAFGAVAGTLIGGLMLTGGGDKFMLLGGVIITIAGTLVTIRATAGRRHAGNT